MLKRILSLVVAAALVGGGVVRADEPPRPPGEAHPIAALAGGAAWKAPAGGGICMDIVAATYQVERVRYYEARIAAAESYAEGSRWRWLMVGIGAGLAVGATAALVRK